jgi:hypothetical protein
VLVHLVALAALMRGPAPGARFDLASVLDRPESEPTPLGLDRSRTVTVAWLGFETPTEHRAPRSAVEQSQLEIDPGRQGGAASPRQIISAAAASAQQARQAAEAAASSLETLLARSAEAIQLARRQSEVAEQIAAAPPAPPAPPPQPAQPAEVESADAGAAGEGQGAAAEKEADATSLTEPLQVELGRVASAEGLEIFTQRPPRLTTLVRRTAMPRNPLVEIEFRGDGAVERAGYRAGESTGYKSVDEPLLDAIYAWRARGSRLEALGEGETITVTMRILLH